VTDFVEMELDNVSYSLIFKLCSVGFFSVVQNNQRIQLLTC